MAKYASVLFKSLFATLCEPVLPTMIVDVFLFSSMDDLWKRRDYKVSLCIYPNASFIWWIPLPAYSEDSQYREYSDYSGHSTLSADSAESLVRKKWPANGKRPNGKIQIFCQMEKFTSRFLASSLPLILKTFQILLLLSVTEN